MKTISKMNSLMIVAAAFLMVFVMAMPAMADHIGTFKGTIARDGQFMTSNGSEYWLVGPHSAQIKTQVGKEVEIKGLLRENVFDYGTPYLNSPTLEVYGYEWLNGSKSVMNMNRSNTVE